MDGYRIPSYLTGICEHIMFPNCFAKDIEAKIGRAAVWEKRYYILPYISFFSENKNTGFFASRYFCYG